MAAFPATPERKDLSTSLLMIQPSRENFEQLRETRSKGDMTDVALFSQTFAAPDSLISEWSLSMGNVVYESQNLRDAVDDFNATAFQEKTTYVRLSDPEIPGPEYDVPYADRVQIRPKTEQAREAWERLYETFRQRRMEVCGLDLEPLMKESTDDAQDDAQEEGGQSEVADEL